MDKYPVSFTPTCFHHQIRHNFDGGAYIYKEIYIIKSYIDFYFSIYIELIETW